MCTLALQSGSSVPHKNADKIPTYCTFHKVFIQQVSQIAYLVLLLKKIQVPIKISRFSPTDSLSSSPYILSRAEAAPDQENFTMLPVPLCVFAKLV